MGRLPPTAGGEQRNNTRNRFSAPHAHPRLQPVLDHQAQPESRTGYIECSATRLPSLTRTTERRKCTGSPSTRQQDGDCECPHSLDSPRGPFRFPMILLRFPFLSGCIFHAAFPAAWPPLGAAAQRIVARSQAAMRIAGRYRTRRYNRR